MMANRFADCDTLEQLLRQVVGAGSVCWREPALQVGDRVFDEEQANRVADEAIERVKQLTRVELAKNLDHLTSVIVDILNDAPMSERVAETAEEIVRAVSRYVALERERVRQRESQAFEGLLRAHHLSRELAGVVEQVCQMLDVRLGTVSGPEPLSTHMPFSTGFNSGSM